MGESFLEAWRFSGRCEESRLPNSMTLTIAASGTAPRTSGGGRSGGGITPGMHCARSACTSHIIQRDSPALSRWAKTRHGTQAPDGHGKMIDSMYAKCRDVPIVFKKKVNLVQLMLDKSHIKRPPKRKPKPAPRPQSAPALSSPRTEAYRIFQKEKKDRIANENASDFKKLPYAQHKLGMQRWEMAKMVGEGGTEEATEWLQRWNERQPKGKAPRPTTAAAAVTSPTTTTTTEGSPSRTSPKRKLSRTSKQRQQAIEQSTSHKWPRPKHVLAPTTSLLRRTRTNESIFSEPEVEPELEETIEIIEPKSPRIHPVPAISRTMKHPTKHTFEPWITSTFKPGIDEQKLVQHEIRLKNASSELAHIRERQAHDAATTSIVCQVKKLAKIKGPVITPLIELAKAECDVAKAKSTLFDVPLSGPSRVECNYAMNPNFNHLRRNERGNERYLCKSVNQFYKDTDPRFSSTYKFKSPAPQLSTVEINGKIG